MKKQTNRHTKNKPTLSIGTYVDAVVVKFRHKLTGRTCQWPGVRTEYSPGCQAVLLRWTRHKKAPQDRLCYRSWCREQETIRLQWLLDNGTGPGRSKRRIISLSSAPPFDFSAQNLLFEMHHKNGSQEQGVHFEAYHEQGPFALQGDWKVNWDFLMHATNGKFPLERGRL